MSDLRYRLLDTPIAPLIIQQAQAILNDEHRKRQEFYQWIDEDKKAEFINGDIVVHSPARDKHKLAVLNLASLLNIYVSERSLGIVRAEKAMAELTRNSYEPDVCFFGSVKAATIEPDQLYYPAPDFVVKVLSKSTQQNDRQVKFEDYAAHGIAEYWIIDPTRRHIEQYHIDTDTNEYEALGTFTIKQSVTSFIIAGFSIPVKALFDIVTYTATLRQLLQP